MIRDHMAARYGVVLAALTVLLSACDRNSNTSSRLPREAAPATQRVGVTLASGQAISVKIAIAQMRQFPLEKDLTGSISYVDDPALIQAESTLLGAAATNNLTQKELRRVKALGDTNGIAQKEMEQAVSDAQTGEAAFKAARDAVRALGKTDAEIDHMVASGRIESPSASRTSKWAIGNIVESESPLFHGGQPVRLRVGSYPDRWFDGVVTEVYSSVDPNSHRLTLRAKISDPHDELRPGMLATLLVETRRPVSTVSIPESGVVREGDGSMTAWTTTDDRHFVQRTVTTGLRSNGNIQILNGLKSGDRVVGDGAIFLDNMLNAAPSD